MTPDATCRPLLAFFALGAAASAALTLVLLAYRNVEHGELSAIEERKANARVREAQERVRRVLSEKAAVKPSLTSRLRAA